GEGKKDFAELLDFVREARFERLGAFAYSEEEGTYGATAYRDRVPRHEKQRRLSELMQLQGEISLAFNESRVATIEKVLVDDYADGVLVCRSSSESPDVDGEIIVRYSPELFKSIPPEELCGKFIDVKITGCDEYDLIAEPVK
ncbi:MAG: 30S ribosomal protein S12 methylthiotransferase RimO, partial [Bacteroidales bacterium]|nr:30S ribosomal protein S12 methylthiotransferase RimO [Bacteroidales bacterium]